MRDREVGREKGVILQGADGLQQQCAQLVFHGCVRSGKAMGPVMLTERSGCAARRAGVTRRTNKSVDNSVGKIHRTRRIVAGNAHFTLVKDGNVIYGNKLWSISESGMSCWRQTRVAPRMCITSGAHPPAHGGRRASWPCHAAAPHCAGVWPTSLPGESRRPEIPCSPPSPKTALSGAAQACAAFFAAHAGVGSGGSDPVDPSGRPSPVDGGRDNRALAAQIRPRAAIETGSPLPITR
jgi:hypothetical protein